MRRPGLGRGSQGAGPVPATPQPLSPTAEKPSCPLVLPVSAVLPCPRICQGQTVDMGREPKGSLPTAPLRPSPFSLQPQQYLSRVLRDAMDRLWDHLLHALHEPGQHPAAGTAMDRDTSLLSTSPSSMRPSRPKTLGESPSLSVTVICMCVVWLLESTYMYHWPKASPVSERNWLES